MNDKGLTKSLFSSRDVQLCLMCMLLVSWFHPRAIAQSEGTTLPSFEVTSIHRDKDPAGSMAITPDAARWYGRHLTTKAILISAFGVEGFQIIGAPSWVSSDRFTVEAKMPEYARKMSEEHEAKEMALMLRSMLASRFNLRYHRASRPAMIFAMHLAKNGPKLQISKADEVYAESVRDGQITATAFTMTDLAQQLSSTLGRIVQDRTALKGRFNFTVHFASDATILLGDPEKLTERDLHSSLEEQLGLRLVREQGQIETIVIDHIDIPSEN